ncbi:MULTISPECIES: helix-turn-helix transcriptional regulator [Actinomycetes]|uniref:helix-turn-helix transcriptional regulator n=1 Tax=Actinomycetes TaxID=1760 RepID=UPI0033CD4797
MERDWSRLGRVMAEAREALKLTQVEVAERIGVSRTPIQSIERGDTRAKITGTMRGYAQLLGWTPESIDRVLAGGEPLMRSADGGAQPAPSRADAAVEPPLPPVLRAELGDGQVLAHGVYDLTEDGSSRIVVVAMGKEGATAEEIDEFVRAWRQRQRGLRQLEASPNPEEDKQDR